MARQSSEKSHAVVLSTEQEALLQTIADYMSGAVPLPTGGATEVTAAAILAKIIAAPATEAKQDTANTALAAILASIGAAGDVAGANTLMGQLKQIAINTTPVI